MSSLPEEIEKRAIHLFNITLERDAERARLNAYEDSIAYDVITERDSNGKPQHSNETLRGIEIRKRQRESVTWLELDSKVQSLEILRIEATARLERVRNELSVWKIEERARIAEMEAGK